MSMTAPDFGGGGSTNTGFIRLMLKVPEERERTQQEIAAVLQRKAARCSPRRAPTWSRSRPSRSAGARARRCSSCCRRPSIDALERSLPRFMDEANQNPAFSFVDVDLKFTNPELRVSIDRARARDLGVAARDVGETLQLALSEQRLGYFLLDGRQYEIISQVERENRNDTADLRNLYVPSASGDPVLLDKLVTVERGEPAAAALPLRPLRRRHGVGGAGAGLHAGRRHRRHARRSPSARSTTRSRPRSPASRATSSSRRTRSCSCSCSRWCWSSWCWRRSSRASAIRW